MQIRQRKSTSLILTPVSEKLLLLTEYIPQSFLLCTDIEYT